MSLPRLIALAPLYLCPIYRTPVPRAGAAQARRRCLLRASRAALWRFDKIFEKIDKRGFCGIIVSRPKPRRKNRRNQRTHHDL